MTTINQNTQKLVHILWSMCTLKCICFDLRLPGGVPFDPAAFIVLIEVRG